MSNSHSFSSSCVFLFACVNSSPSTFLTHICRRPSPSLQPLLTRKIYSYLLSTSWSGSNQTSCPLIVWSVIIKIILLYTEGKPQPKSFDTSSVKGKRITNFLSQHVYACSECVFFLPLIFTFTNFPISPTTTRPEDVGKSQIVFNSDRMNSPPSKCPRKSCRHSGVLS